MYGAATPGIVLLICHGMGIEHFSEYVLARYLQISHKVLVTDDTGTVATALSNLTDLKRYVSDSKLGGTYRKFSNKRTSPNKGTP